MGEQLFRQLAHRFGRGRAWDLDRQVVHTHGFPSRNIYGSVEGVLNGLTANITR